MSFDSEKNILKEKAKETIKKCIREYFDSFKVVPKLKKDGTLSKVGFKNYMDLYAERLLTNDSSPFWKKELENIHPLDSIFPQERRAHSIIHGLITSMGTKVWEPLAIMYAKYNEFEVLDKDDFNKKVPSIPDNVRRELQDFEKNKLSDPSLDCSTYFNDIKEFISKESIVITERKKIKKGTGIDLWFKKNETYYVIDTKTTQLNSGGGPKFLTNILNWYTYSALLGHENTKCFIAFPFNPHLNHDFWDKEGGKISPLQKNSEAFSGDDFWSMLSGIDGTDTSILEAFAELSDENFAEEFEEIFSID